ncbi:MAG: helix-turn-helix domain-containing protein [Bacteroidetes bacterium]|nr:helix-turn-helix domain-containing protein [Bacteroidota bacterium]MDE2671713.1 helix-turn-helix domain-containing protein [Bacteroidota bacterium]
MRLTVAELARRVRRSEVYVRQHIHRNHLSAQKDGRNVYVPVKEALRWAHERGLPFEMPAGAITPMGGHGRVARITVLAKRGQDGSLSNLFTLVRHRRQDTVGPWARPADGLWVPEDLDDDLLLFSCDASLDVCKSLTNQVVESQKLEIEGKVVQFALNPFPRLHLAYRDERPDTEAAVLSPFKRHSAAVREYWNVSHDLQEEWQQLVAEQPPNFAARLNRLGFPLAKRSERVGNLMIAGAEDAVTCRLAAGNNGTLNFHAEFHDTETTPYHATIWASHCGDEVLRREIRVVPGHRILDLESDVDRIGFAVYRTTDGQCVDLNQVLLIKDIVIQGTLIGGPTMQFKTRGGRLIHEVNPFVHRSTIDIKYDLENRAIDKEVRRQWLYRLAGNQELDKRRQQVFARFSPGKFNEAIRFFLGLMCVFSNKREAIYIADPYFLKLFKAKGGKKAFLDIAEITSEHQLRILCCSTKIEFAREFLSKLPRSLISHVQIRSFRKVVNYVKSVSVGAFHDRYLITPNSEVIITHSLNGWRKGGVTIANIPYGVYRAEAERLWAVSPGSADGSIKVTEIH